MRSYSLGKQHSVILASAVLASQSLAEKVYFRQRDVRFLVELFSNWLELSLESSVLEIKNVQISRYLAELVEEGCSERRDANRRPQYRLTRFGIIELIGRISGASSKLDPFAIIFRCYFIANYRERIIALVKGENKRFPPSLAIEVEALLDVRSLIDEELDAVNRKILKVELRERESKAATEMARNLYRKGASNAEVAREIEKAHPYELNSQRPLSNLMASLRPDHARWEFEFGGLCRAEQIWSPSKEILKSYRLILIRLKKDSNK